MKARTAWVSAIIGLLAANVGASGVLIFASHDGGSQVIPNYYERALEYDRTIDQETADRALGWRVGVAAAGGIVTVTVADRGGAPLSGAAVQVHGYPRTHADETVDASLVAHGAGVYVAPVLRRTGWHDLTVAVRRGTQVFVEHESVEAR